MLVPSSVFQLLALVLLVVPGIVFAAVRRRLTGPTPEDRDFSARIARALAFSLTIDLLYLAIGGSNLVNAAGVATVGGHIALRDPALHASRKALGAFGLLLVVPAALGYLAHWRVESRGDKWWHLGLRLQRIYHPTPTAWDRAAPVRGGCFVRILKDDGHWVGGFSYGRGFVSTYPEPRDIFIEIQYRMGKDGTFLGPIDNSLGVFVPLNGAETVAWVALPPPESDDESA